MCRIEGLQHRNIVLSSENEDLAAIDAELSISPRLVQSNALIKDEVIYKHQQHIWTLSRKPQ